MKKSQNIMKMILCKLFFRFLCLYWQLQLQKAVIFRLEAYALKQNLEGIVIPHFDLSEKIGKAVPT